MSKFISEFKEFAIKRNAVDVAVGVVIAAAFGKIVTSVVNDLIMPLLSLLVGRVNFYDLKVVLEPAAGELQEVAVNYGAFIQSVIDFLIIALAIFIAVKLINKVNRKKEEPEEVPEATKVETLLEDIKFILGGKSQDN